MLADFSVLFVYFFFMLIAPFYFTDNLFLCFRGPLAALLATLAACSAVQYTPVAIDDSSSECALLLEGPGRSSVFDHNLNVLRGSL